MKKILLLMPIYTTLVFIFIYELNKYFDNDVFNMIATGNNIIKYGIPKYNPFFNIDKIPIIIQQWGWCVLLAAIYNSSGFIGLYILNLLQILLFTFTTYILLKDYIPKKWCVIIGLFLPSLCFINNLRPELITIILIFWDIIIFEKYDKTNKPVFLLFLPIITLLEMNLHGSIWAIHFGILLVNIISKCFTAKEKIKKDCVIIAISVLLMIASLWVNPYGTQGITYCINSLTCTMNLNIRELCPPTVLSFIGIVSIILMIFSIFSLFYKGNKNKYEYKLQTFVYSFIISLITFQIKRGIYFAPLAIIYIIRWVKNIVNIERFNSQIFQCLKSNKAYKIISSIVIYIYCLILLITLGINYKIPLYEKDVVNKDLYEIGKYLKQKEINTDPLIFTSFNYGNYLEFLGYKTFFDSRPEIFDTPLNEKYNFLQKYLSKNTYLKLYEKLTTAVNPKLVKDFFKYFEFDYIVTDDMLLMTYFSANDNYKIVIENNLCLYEKIGS